MNLISPYGVRVSTTDSRGEFLIQHCGFRRVGAKAQPKAEAEAPPPEPAISEKPAKRRRTPKQTDEGSDSQ